MHWGRKRKGDNYFKKRVNGLFGSEIKGFGVV